MNHRQHLLSLILILLVALVPQAIAQDDSTVLAVDLLYARIDPSFRY